MSDLIEVGRTMGPYGVRGWVKIAPGADGEAMLGTKKWLFKSVAGGDPVPLEVQGVKPHGKVFVAKWKGCEAPEEAPAWKGAILIDRKDFPELADDELWAADFIGCTVVTKEGEALGRVASLESNGVQDLLAVDPGAGRKPFLIPVVEAYVLEIDVREKRITVDWGRDWL